MKYEVKQSNYGKGIFARVIIREGEVITPIEYVREITLDAPRKEGELFEHQMYQPDGRVFLVSEPFRYFNHSCEPNAWLFSADQQYYVIAKHNITPDEEITIDYELSAINDETWEKVYCGESSLRKCEGVVDAEEWKCECGAEKCRGLHRWDFFTLPLQTILESLPYLDPWFVQVHGKRIRELLESGHETAKDKK